MGGSNNPQYNAYIASQMKEIAENPPQNWRLVHKEGNIWHLDITVNNDSPFWGLPFKVIVTVPQNFPESLPQTVMQQPKRFFHPNINCIRGNICDKISQSSNKFLTIRDRVDGLILLLQNPNPDSPLNAQAARLILDNPDKPEIYYQKAFLKFRKLI